MSWADPRRAEPAVVHPVRDVVPITLARDRRAAAAGAADWRRSDAELDEAVRTALLEIAPLVGAALHAEARDGVVVLTGAVDADAERLLVVQQVAAVPGVRVVLCGVVLRCHPAAGSSAHAPVRLLRVL
jgi:hypothetical protein